MGRWPYSSRRTVEECKSISTYFLNQNGFFSSSFKSGTLVWNENSCRESSIGLMILINGNQGHLRLMYSKKKGLTDEKSVLDYKVRLTSTPCNFGGLRWWFICPLAINNVVCQKRVGKLYLSHGLYFGCRHCHNLTYQSSQESHKYDRLFKDSGFSAREVAMLLRNKDF